MSGEFASVVTPDGESLVEACREAFAAGNPRLPRFDQPTLAALLAVHRALALAASAGLEVANSDRALLWAAVEHGSALADREYWETANTAGGALSSPLLFAATLPSAVVGEVALTFGLRGPAIVVAGAGGEDQVPEDVLACLPEGIDALVVLTLTGWTSGSPQAAAFVRHLSRARMARDGA